MIQISRQEKLEALLILRSGLVDILKQMDVLTETAGDKIALEFYRTMHGVRQRFDDLIHRCDKRINELERTKK